MLLPTIHLKRDDERRLLAGHRWIFSNEIARIETPGDSEVASELSLGSPVLVRSSQGRLLGAAHYNRHALIAGRLFADKAAAATLHSGETTEEAILLGALDEAVARRAAMPGLHPHAHRLVFGDSDGLPGLIADRYGPAVCVQFLTAGMARHRDTIVARLMALPGVEAVWEKTGGPYLDFEGLEPVNEWRAGKLELPLRLLGSTGAPAMAIDFPSAQKTGSFLDQRANQSWLGSYVRQLAAARSGSAPLRLLDVFCYHAGWSIAAIVAGRESGGEVHAVAVDSSAEALRGAALDAELNALAPSLETREGDAFQVLELAAAAGESYDVAVVDPPAFAKARKDVSRSLKAYEKLNTLAAQLVAPGGMLVSCSCSYHVEADAFDKLLVRSLRHAGRRAQIAHIGGQAPDHPVLLGMRETNYLKMVALRFLD